MCQQWHRCPPAVRLRRMGERSRRRRVLLRARLLWIGSGQRRPLPRRPLAILREASASTIATASTPSIASTAASSTTKPPISATATLASTTAASTCPAIATARATISSYAAASAAATIAAPGPMRVHVGGLLRE